MSIKIKRKLKQGISSDEHLKDLQPVVVNLADGSCVTLRLSDEFSPMDDTDSVYNEAKTVSAKFVFWSMQASLARAKVDNQLSNIDKIVAAFDIHTRTDSSFSTITERAVKSYVDMQPSVIEAHEKLNELKSHYLDLKSIADAMRQRCFIVSNLIKPAVESQIGV